MGAVEGRHRPRPLCPRCPAASANKRRPERGRAPGAAGQPVVAVPPRRGGARPRPGPAGLRPCGAAPGRAPSRSSRPRPSPCPAGSRRAPRALSAAGPGGCSVPEASAEPTPRSGAAPQGRAGPRRARGAAVLSRCSPSPPGARRDRSVGRGLLRCREALTAAEAFAVAPQPFLRARGVPHLARALCRGLEALIAAAGLTPGPSPRSLRYPPCPRPLPLPLPWP